MSVVAGRVRAPELIGAGGWINTDRPLRLADLRGRAVLLDFWTFCCINCIRVVEELRVLERRFGDALVVIGVHSPKFPHERDHDAVRRAAQRHRIEHPVLDDPDMETWQRYGVRAWPTLVLIDPDGYIAAVAAGEGQGRAVAELIERLLAGRELPNNAAVAAPRATDGALLSFPGKVATDDARIAVADTGHDRVLVCAQDGLVLQVFDGFAQPQGVRIDGDRLLVCDTVAGRVVAISLDTGTRTVLADGLHSPWDAVVLPDGDIAVAEAGLHRIVAVPRDGGEVRVLAGTRAEGLRDGPALQAHLAQPSGLTLLPDGALAFADSEVSALRVLRGGQVSTLAGSGLFDWGSSDGSRDDARLQHPLGVASLGDGRIAVADTFNSRLRVWEEGVLRTLDVDTLLDEPGGLDVLPDGRLVAADTNAHRIVAVDLTTGHAQPLALLEQGEPVRGEPGGDVELTVTLDLDGADLDLSQGEPVRVALRAEPPSLLETNGTHAASTLPARVALRLGAAGEGMLEVDVTAATCAGDVCTIQRRTRRHSLTVAAG